LDEDAGGEIALGQTCRRKHSWKKLLLHTCIRRTTKKSIKGKGLTEAESSQLGNACRS
jgi:hypothetical protein